MNRPDQSRAQFFSRRVPRKTNLLVLLIVAFMAFCLFSFLQPIVKPKSLSSRPGKWKIPASAVVSPDKQIAADTASVI